jgi:signal transduction histidine kinase
MHSPTTNFAMEADQPHAIDVIASGIHDAKNNMFDALARVGVAVQAIHDGKAAAALPALAEIETAVSASAQRLSKLLSAYRLLRHENPVSMMPVDVPGLLEDVLIRVRESNADGIALRGECRFQGFWVCDRELVADCLINALQNALRHARGAVSLAAEEAGGQLVLTVADDGPGLPEDLPAHADGTHSGVGFFIARRIAHLHERHGRHGALELGNGKPLGGAVVRLVLP